MNEVAKQIRAEIGDPTIIVNNAGIAIGRTIINTPTDAMMRVMAVNTYAHIFAAKIFLPHMIKINHGHIVTVASSAAYVSYQTGFFVQVGGLAHHPLDESI